MMKSRFLKGLLAEDPQAARAHVWSFDHANLVDEVNDQFLFGNKLPPEDEIRHARDADFILPVGPNDWRGAKLSRVLSHFDLRFSVSPTEAELTVLCLEAEGKAVALLKVLHGKTAKGGSTPFTGGTIDDLTRYVLCRMFEELDASFAQKPAAEKEHMAADIVKRLAELPEDVRERIRKEAGLASLSTSALMQTGSIAAVGGAMVGTVGLAGFAAYTTLTTFIAAAAGLVGATLPFGFYTIATSTLAAVSNPLLVVGAALGGGWFFINRANRQMRDRLLPVMIATSVIAFSASDNQTLNPAAMARLLAAHYYRGKAGDVRLRGQISRTFVCLPKMD